MKLQNLMTGLVNLVVGVAWTLLGLRFVLRLFGANPSNGFVDWVYDASGEILAPFRGIFSTPNFDGFTVDFTALFAMLVYGLIAMLAIYLITLLTPSSTTKKR